MSKRLLKIDQQIASLHEVSGLCENVADALEVGREQGHALNLRMVVGATISGRSLTVEEAIDLWTHAALITESLKLYCRTLQAGDSSKNAVERVE